MFLATEISLTLLSVRTGRIFWKKSLNVNAVDSSMTMTTTSSSFDEPVCSYFGQLPSSGGGIPVIFLIVRRNGNTNNNAKVLAFDVENGALRGEWMVESVNENQSGFGFGFGKCVWEQGKVNQVGKIRGSQGRLLVIAGNGYNEVAEVEGDAPEGESCTSSENHNDQLLWVINLSAGVGRRKKKKKGEIAGSQECLKDPQVIPLSSTQCSNIRQVEILPDDRIQVQCDDFINFAERSNENACWEFVESQPVSVPVSDEFYPSNTKKVGRLFSNVEDDEFVAYVDLYEPRKVRIRNIVDGEEKTVVLGEKVLPEGTRIVEIFLQVFATVSGGTGKRLFLVRSDGVFLATKKGDVALWVRHDGLADVQQGNCLIVSRKLSQKQTTDLSNPWLRLHAQIEALVPPEWLVEKLKNPGTWKELLGLLPFGLGERLFGISAKPGPVSSMGERDARFGLEYQIVALTKWGTLYVLRIDDGSIVSSLSIFGSDAAELITSIHAVSGGVVAIVAQSSFDTRVLRVDLESLTIVSDESLPFECRQAIFGERGSMMLVDESMIVHAVAEFDPINRFAFVEGSLSDGIVKGYVAHGTDLQQVWERDLGAPVLVIADSRIGDGFSDLFDLNQTEAIYRNPGILGIVVQTSETVLDLFVVDGTSGEVLHQVTHEDASPPVSMFPFDAHSFVYTFRNLKLDQDQLSLLEFFGEVNAKKPSSRPQRVESASFLLPFEVGSSAVTRTGDGRTPPNLLFALPAQDAILVVERHFLNTRRGFAVDPKTRQTPDGLPMYHPHLPQTFLTANLSVHGVRAIFSSPTSFESTTQVIAFGTDVFYLRYCPSMGEVCYDTIGAGFDKSLIALICILFVVLTLVARWYSNKQSLKGVWA